MEKQRRRDGWGGGRGRERSESTLRTDLESAHRRRSSVSEFVVFYG
jgi:hypothetical protein